MLRLSPTAPVMDPSATPTKSLRRSFGMGGIIALILAIGLVGGWLNLNRLDPYVQDVLALNGDQTRGAAIFQTNCAVCHGIRAAGDIGPSLVGVPQRKSRVHLIEQVTSGKTPPMPQFQPNAQAMADLLSYLETL